MTFVTENQSFSLTRYHDLFPSFFPLHVFELIDVMGFEVSPFLPTELADVCFKSLL